MDTCFYIFTNKAQKMKKILLLLLPVFLQAQYTPINSNVVALYYPTVGITQTGGDVSLWEDQSAQGNDLTYVTTGPTYNTTYLSFERTNTESMINSAPVSGFDFGTANFQIEVYAAAKDAGDNGYAAVMSFYQGSTNAQFGFYLYEHINRIDFKITDDATHSVTGQFAYTFDDNFHYFRFEVDRTNNQLRCYVDNVQVGSNVDISSVTGNITNTSCALYIGRYSSVYYDYDLAMLRISKTLLGDGADLLSWINGGYVIETATQDKGFKERNKRTIRKTRKTR